MGHDAGTGAPRRALLAAVAAIAMTLAGATARAEPLERPDATWPAAAESVAARDVDSPVAWSALPTGELIDALRAGGLTLLFRHGEATGIDRDPAPWRGGDRRAQRNLTALGKDQARAVGDGMRALGAPVASVVASPYVRARDFAEIAFRAKPVVAIDLGPDRAGYAAAYRRYLGAAPPAGANAVVVGHVLAPTPAQVSQLDELADGHCAVYRPDGRGGATLVALIAPGDWARLVAASKRG